MRLELASISRRCCIVPCSALKVCAAERAPRPWPSPLL
ncbi:hypothetical protein E2C01_062084 [Portunus trituberculatus]|uniref:Uncharacterized protein n=1 Tax=Portunus trituberculatus TaxID=210409 RepID=A0A5B7HDL1_PORTR|nr:hypothetical protein [Portunus trituberculatus]